MLARSPAHAYKRRQNGPAGFNRERTCERNQGHKKGRTRLLGRARYVDQVVDDLGEALQRVMAAREQQKPLSVGVIGNAGDVFPRLVEMGVTPDVVTDQTSAHDPLSYVPHGMSFDEAMALRERDPAEYQRQARRTMAV
ncbi:TPA: hypothetical protein EYP38_04825, partial [Candidatus Micrarchaeota archaeon]|nr:hypothetical protein [Candidatus Micrarchaeota archaeon]